MSTSLPQADAVTQRRGRPLSARKVKDLVAIGQTWQHEDGAVWCLCNIYRHDGQVHIARTEGRRAYCRFPAFAELGRDYRLLEDR